jgi:hypothetical protein
MRKEAAIFPSILLCPSLPRSELSSCVTLISFTAAMQSCFTLLATGLAVHERAATVAIWRLRIACSFTKPDNWRVPEIAQPLSRQHSMSECRCVLTCSATVYCSSISKHVSLHEHLGYIYWNYNQYNPDFGVITGESTNIFSLLKQEALAHVTPQVASSVGRC